MFLMTTLYSLLFLVCGLTYVLPHDTIPPRHDRLMTLYDGYYSDSFTITFQFMYAVIASLISNIILLGNRTSLVTLVLGPREL